MKTIHSFLFTLIFSFFLVSAGFSQTEKFSDSWGINGYSILNSDLSNITLNFSVEAVDFNDFEIDGKMYKKISIPGTFLPNNAGAPDLPGMGRYIAIPEDANVSLKIIDFRTEIYENVEVSPAPIIPVESDPSPIKYPIDQNIYGKNANYPEQFVKISEVQQIRGVDVVLVGVTPFQYNPITKQLILYRDIKISLEVNGGTGYVGEDRLRNRYWDRIIKGNILNSDILPKINYNQRVTEADGYDYVIIVPQDDNFIAWADTIKNFRQTQGISTKVVTVTEIGGNTASAIENYINDIYANWNPAPAAVLLLADHGTGATGIVSPSDSHPYSGSMISDNKYADVDGNILPDITFARITARNPSELELMINKFINYEKNPPQNQNYYNKPVTAMGWQTERWFQLCSEIINGFWEFELGKEPVRENAIYSGTPSGSWSSNQNTNMIVSYFGPNGLNYIPGTPNHLTDWGGNATRLNNDMNSGAFMVQHRDHGGETGWGEPDYGNSDINNLNNEDLTFVFSINCLTGKFDYGSECFTEKFHRHPTGALGLLAATEVSYSFVNDTYVWGLYDYMWPQFMPAYGEDMPEQLLPAFGNVAGKYFLQQSNWPYNTGDKEVTYKLFHQHGDAFSVVYSEMPQDLSVAHLNAMISGVTEFSVQADVNSLICISLDGEILGTAEGNGASVPVQVPFVQPGKNILVTVTKQNYFRYESYVPVIPADGAYVVKNNVEIDDSEANNNGQLDYGESVKLNFSVENVGLTNAENVTVNISSQNEFVTITDDTEFFGSVAANDTVTVNSAFAITVAENVPNLNNISFSVSATDGTEIWESSFVLKANAPLLEFYSFEIFDNQGNHNGKLDPGETAEIKIILKNNGNSDAYNVLANLIASDSYVTVLDTDVPYDTVKASEMKENVFNVTVDLNTPEGHTEHFDLTATGDMGVTASDNFFVVIGQFPVVIVDLDENHNSGPAIVEAFTNNGLAAEYMTTFPADLNLYTSIFVCLGTYSNNATLSSDQGTKLAQFLNNGGRVYMEGGDTWYYDTQTAVHPMFNIDGTADGTGDLSTIQGVSGTFTNGMQFSYTGDNSWVDHIEAISPAVKIFNNQTPNYGTMVAHDAGSYKTIGSSMEFGGLANGSFPSTRDEVIAQFIDFFDLGAPSNDTIICKDVTFNEGWNLVSSPVDVSDMGMNQIFPTAASAPFSFHGSYIVEDHMECGLGYWLKFNTAGSEELCGFQLSGPIPVQAEWNIIGVYDSIISASQISSYPAGIIASQFFEYNSGYSVATDLMPGAGYWIKTTASGELLLNEPVVSKKSEFNFNELPSISFINENSREVKLFLNNSENEVLAELPPVPPAGSFDARFENNKFVEELSTDIKYIYLSGNENVKIKANDVDLKIYDAYNQDNFSVVLKSGNEAAITVKGQTKLAIQTVEIPDEFALYQNYPNPFNPTTNIKFALPDNAIVKINVYNILGERVAELINKQMEPGYHTIEFNASQLASGIYFYSIEAGRFVNTKKLMLLK